MSVQILDGRRLAAVRAPLIAERAAAVWQARGYAPRLLLMAFADERGVVPHVEAKLRACRAAGIDAVPVLLDAGAGSDEALHTLQDAIRAHAPDGVFVQVPFPAGMDGGVVASAIPVDADVDVMTPQRYAAYMNATQDLPPLTVTAALLLLDAHGVQVRGRRGVVVADESPFSLMLSTALQRRGAVMQPVLDPVAAGAAHVVESADLVVVAAGRPALLDAGALVPGCVAIDVGYFNEGGRGDIDTSQGADHLGALMPVPGGVGPMTVSALLERVVQFAEGGADQWQIRL